MFLFMFHQVSPHKNDLPDVVVRQTRHKKIISNVHANLILKDGSEIKHDCFGTKHFDAGTTHDDFNPKHFKETTKQNCFEAKHFNGKTTHDAFGIKHFNDGTTHDAFEATRFNFETEHFNFDLKRFNEMTKRDAFGTKQFNFNPKPFNERSFSGEIESSVSKMDSAKDILDDFRTKTTIWRIGSGAVQNVGGASVLASRRLKKLSGPPGSRGRSSHPSSYILFELGMDLKHDAS